MAFIQWNEDFMTGITRFDEHHQKLVALLNTTYDDFICGAPDECLGAILKELIDYTGYHFDAEESWLREINYPKLTEHKHDHDKFLRCVQSFQNDFQGGKTSISLDVLTFLKRWLREHILESDSDYVRFISSQQAAHPSG